MPCRGVGAVGGRALRGSARSRSVDEGDCLEKSRHTAGDEDDVVFLGDEVVAREKVRRAVQRAGKFLYGRGAESLPANSGLNCIRPPARTPPLTTRYFSFCRARPRRHTTPRDP